MKVYENPLYLDDVRAVAGLELPWEQLQDSSVLISGASGLVGSCMIDAVMYRNAESGMNCTVYAMGRGEEKARERFGYCWGSKHFKFLPHDINEPLEREDLGRISYVLHLASNTHPLAYATDPIGTVTTNIIGTNNMLKFAVRHGAKRFAFASSNEIYGENRGDVELFDESYCGYIDSNTMRAGYPESKRCGEALCQAYLRQEGLDVVIPRLTRSYGPTMLMSDTKAISQFIRKGIAGENIVLKSAGTQYYSYTYVADAVSGLLTVLLKGETGTAYNIADESGDIMLKDLAALIAGCAGTKVVFECPDEVEKAGYSTATKARLDGSRLKGLGWNPRFDMETGIRRTIDILRN
ncbi:MAG: NAD-dependent epimerase/dehydratase family protein [Oscillospiraceae bacterium]|nr:NAD-dependent epimerase/dehydratase family protein [Oscillospiraceae bacterium]